MYRSKTYYRIRTLVRCVFYTTLTYAVLMGAAWLHENAPEQPERFLTIETVTDR